MQTLSLGNASTGELQIGTDAMPEESSGNETGASLLSLTQEQEQ
jgi:hypothetical protein